MIFLCILIGFAVLYLLVWKLTIKKYRKLYCQAAKYGRAAEFKSLVKYTKYSYHPGLMNELYMEAIRGAELSTNSEIHSGEKRS